MAKRRPLIFLAVGLGLTATAAAGLMAAGALHPAALPQAVAPASGAGIPAGAPLAGADQPGSPPATAVPAAHPAVLRLNDEGVTLYEIGRFSDALAKFEQAIASDGLDQVSRRNLALTKARLAWGYLENGNYRDALNTFAEADRAQPGEGGVLQGLGVTYYKLGKPMQAEAFLERALDADANLAPALKLLGEIAYRRDDLEEAKARFAEAFRLDPSDVDVRDRLERVREEARAQTGFRALEGRHFTVRFEGREETAVAHDVLRRLESAYRDVGRRWGAFPDGKVPVVLYRDREFRDLTVSPEWAQGMFDGKIRLPVVGVEHRGERLDKAVRHEYTHALVHARTGGNVPTWLSEGLAIAAENRATEEAREVLRKSGHLIPLPELHGSFLTLPPTQVPLAYAESEAAVSYLLARHGEAAIRALLMRLGETKDFAAALRDVTGATYAEFQAAWMRSLIGTPG